MPVGGHNKSIFVSKCRAHDLILGFITSSWQITSREKFAACCIGVLCLGGFLELLGRVGIMYDKYILRQFQYAPLPSSDGQEHVFGAKTSQNPPLNQATNNAVLADAKFKNQVPPQGLYLGTARLFRPSMVQQGIRAGIHTFRFGTAYLIMLLAMTLNGFLILTILGGAYVGSFMFDWEAITTG